MTNPTKWPMSPAKTQISLSRCPVHQSSLCSLWIVWILRPLRADTEDSDQTGRMPMIVWIFCWFCRVIQCLFFLSAFMFLKNSSAKTNNAEGCEPRHDKTNKMSAPGEDPDQPGHLPSLIRVFACAQWVAKDPSFLHADSEDSNQTGWMPRLICLRWAHIYFVGFVMSRLIFLLNLCVSHPWDKPIPFYA